MTRDHNPEIARRNRATWDGWSDGYQSKHGGMLADNAEAWGLWRRPERDLKVLDDVSGRDVLELGCGAAAWSRSLADRGARVAAVDISHRQLMHAVQPLDRSTGRVRYVQANGERLPFRAACFDIVFSDYGALSWADPYRTVPAIRQVLRPAGQLAFCTNSPLFAMCWDSDSRKLLPTLRHPYFSLHTRKVSAEAVDYVLPYGEWIALFAANDMTVESLIEQPPAAGSVTTFGDRSPRWTANWPLEVIWRVRRNRDDGHRQA